MVKVSWKQVWNEFEIWAEKAEKEGKCKTCGHKSYSHFEWEDQQRAIQRIVNKQIRGDS